MCLPCLRLLTCVATACLSHKPQLHAIGPCHTDLGKGAAKGKSSASTQPGEVAARLAGKYGGSFLACFDIQLDCCSEDLEDLDLWADQLLSAAQRRQQAVQAACTGGTGTAAWQLLLCSLVVGCMGSVCCP